MFRIVMYSRRVKVLPFADNRSLMAPHNDINSRVITRLVTSSPMTLVRRVRDVYNGELWSVKGHLLRTYCDKGNRI